MKNKLLAIALCIAFLFNVNAVAFSGEVSAPEMGSLINVGTVLNNKVSEIKLDSNSCRILNSCGKAEVLTDVVSKGVRYIDLSYNNGMIASAIVSEAGVDLAIKEGDVVTTYRDGEEISSFAINSMSESKEILSEVEDYIQSHCVDDILETYQGAYLKESGEIVLPDYCYNTLNLSTQGPSVIGNPVDTASLSASSTTEVIPVDFATSYPPMTQKIVSERSYYSQSINKTLNARVTTTRDNYHIVKSTWSSVAAGISLATAGTLLGVKAITLSAILTAVGALDGANTLITNIKFASEMQYSARMSKVGWIYDDTTYLDYVRYIGTTFSGTGKYSLTWDTDSSNMKSNFRWACTVQPKYTDRTNLQVSNMVIEAYEGDIIYGGACGVPLYCVWNHNNLTV